LTMNDFKYLLEKNNLIKKEQFKWKRSLSEGKINILEEVYTLKVTDNKRKLIYDKNNCLIGTKNYMIDNSKYLK
jgi:hypothetical protein